MKSEAYSISATDIEIWAKIGVHAEEALVENCFRVSVWVDASAPYAKGQYLNYEIIADKVHAVFSKPHQVLEDICTDIIAELHVAFPLQVRRITCEIKKMNPAIKGSRIAYLSANLTRVFE